MKPITAQVEVFVPRPPRIVFEFFADLRNEPRYNPQVRDIRKTTEGPLARGTTFEGQHAGLGSVSWTLVEFDAPHHVAIEGRVGAGSYRWVSDFEPSGDGTTIRGRMEWQPGNVLRFFAPVLGPLLRLNAQRTFGKLAEALTSGPVGS
jgi:hypothetical protein